MIGPEQSLVAPLVCKYGILTILSVVLGVFKLARSVGFKPHFRRCPKGYNLAVKIAVTAFVVLSKQSYVKVLKLFEGTFLFRKNG